MWAGASGKQYKYWISPVSKSLINEPGSFIFARQTSPSGWIPLYIGQISSLKNKLGDHEKMLCVRQNGGTHIHAHTSSASEEDRKAEEADLLANWDPFCNKNEGER
jgi:hypothetical protein